MYDLIEKLDTFNFVKYIDETHEYFIDGQKVPLSATKILSNLKIPFDTDKWSTKKAMERNIPLEDILAEWKLKSLISTEKGTIFHNYVENYLSNKIFPYPEKRILSVPEFNGIDIIRPKFDKLISLFDSFYTLMKGRLIPVRSEFVVGDRELNIAGMIDQIFYNKKTGKLEIWDWKTNKAISTENKYQKFKSPISHLDECELNTYSLQLNIYKYIIEKNTGLQFGDCYIAWFFEENTDFKIIKTLPLHTEVKLILNVM